MKYYLLPLGCQMNQSDTGRVRTVLHRMGFVPTDNEDEATILGVIACSVRQKGIDKVYGRIEKWNAMKNRQNVITFVSGCILPADRVRFLKLFDLVFPMNELPNFPDMIRQYGIVTPASLKMGEEIPYQPVVQPQMPLFNKHDKVNPSANMEPFWAITEDYLKGVEMIIKQFGALAEDLNLETIGAAGESFDPNLHDAVMHIEDEALGENVIAEVLQKGYKLGDTVVRPAIVKVAN